MTPQQALQVIENAIEQKTTGTKPEHIQFQNCINVIKEALNSPPPIEAPKE